MRALHTVHDSAHRIRRLNRERFGIAARGHEREHHHVGIAVEKYVFYEFLGSKAVEITPPAGFGGKPTASFGRPLESIGRRRFYPPAGWVDEVPLHVEDKLSLAAEPRLRELRIEGGFSFKLEETVTLPRCSVRRIECEQRACRAASRNQEIAAAEAQALCVLGYRLVRQVVTGAIGRRERNGHDFPVLSRDQFGRQPPAFGINHVCHGNEYIPRDDGWRMTDPLFSPPHDPLVCCTVN